MCCFGSVPLCKLTGWKRPLCKLPRPMLDGAVVHQRLQRTRTISCPFVYAKLALRLDTVTPVSDKLFRDVVAEALRQLHGYVGGALQIDILASQESSAIIKVDKRDWSKLWSALTLLTAYQGFSCRVEVRYTCVKLVSSTLLIISYCLLGMQASPNSRSTSRTLLESGHSSHSIGSPISPISPLNLETASLLQQNELTRPAHKSRLLTATVVFAWFVSNIGLLLMNKYLLSNYGFKQPVFLTLCHMLACVVLSTAFSATNYVPKKSIQSSRQLMKISVLAVVFAMSVVLGNISLKFIPVSFSQAVGATTPAFTAVLSLLIINARESSRTYAALLPVVIGIVIATGAEPSFNLAGFTAAVTATAARAFKSVLQGILLTDATEKMDSMNLLRYMAPVSLGVLVPATIFLEPGVFELVSASRADMFFVIFLSLNAALAYFVNLLNFLVTKHTSALTLQVLGNGKGVAAVVVSVMVFRNPVTFASVIGYLITVSGVMLYMFAKRSSAEAKKLSPEKGAGDGAV